MSSSATAAAEDPSLTPACHSLMEQVWKRSRYKVGGDCHPWCVLALGTGKRSQDNRANCYMRCGAPGTSLTNRGQPSEERGYSLCSRGIKSWANENINKIMMQNHNGITLLNAEKNGLQGNKCVCPKTSIHKSPFEVKGKS